MSAGHSSGRTAALVFVAVVIGYSLLAWDKLPQASAQFHFVDLAHSFMAGRLDTATPRQNSRRAAADDPRGYREAIKRTVDSGGWNDWAGVRTLKLKDGSTVRGTFPWGDSDGENKHLFHSIDGNAYKIDTRTDLARDCGDTGRATCDETTHYVSFPPVPAVVMLPFAAIWGYDANDVLITVLVGGLNAALLFLLLQLLTARGHSGRSERDNVWLALMFAFGTVAFFTSVRGEVWFTALVFGVALNIGFMLAALDLKHPILAGLLLGLGMATRTPIAFCFVFFAWQLFFPGNKWDGGRWGDIFKRGLAFAVPILVIGGLLMAYNHARFDDPFEFGHSFLGGGAAKRIRDHGLFNTWYINGNLAAALVNMPRFMPEAPFVNITKHGVGLLFSTPVLLLLARPRTSPPLRRALWVTVIAAAIPGLLYQNTGWEQFGYRFAMDYLPYLVALLAIGGRPLTTPVKGAIVFGVLVNLFGAVTFGRFPELYY